MIRFGDAWDYFRHQLDAGNARRHLRPRQDGDGRRLRASAYGRSRAAALAPSGAPSWASVVAKAVMAVLLASIAFVASSKEYVNYAGSLPDAESIATTGVPPADSLLYAGDGTTLIADVHRPGNYFYPEPLSQMGTLLPEATVAVEDANFYHEPGIDITGIVRAAIIDWRSHQPVQGASTITQQLIKVRLKQNQPTLTRKIKEAIEALQVERVFTKQQILEMYLNTIFYGNESTGAAAAAKNYFHLPVAKLDLAQAAMLAGIPRNPTYANPFVNWAGAKNRQLQVLNAMLKVHEITKAQVDAAYAEDLSPPKHMFTPQDPSIAPGFVQYVTQQIDTRYGTNAATDDGLHVVTTLNLGLQHIAMRVLSNNLATNGVSNGFTQSALTSIDPHTGAIVAMVGSMPNKPGSAYNFAYNTPRQPGSSMKIYTYTAAIASQKFTMVTPIADTPMTIPASVLGTTSPYHPSNYDQGYHGICMLQQCMGNSYNIPALKVELSLGVPAVIQEARNMGAPPWTGKPLNQAAPLTAYPISSTLGSVYETPLQMATGASVLAAGGVLHPPYAIRSISNSDGSQIFRVNPSGDAKQVLDPGVAYIMAQIMSNNANRINAFGSTTVYLTEPNRRIAAKTGTTENFTDGWTVGFTPALTVAIWTGNANYQALAFGDDAVLDAGPAFHDYMYDATAYLNEPTSDWFSQPPNLTSMNWNGEPAWFLPGTSPYTKPPALPSWVQTSGSPTNTDNGCFGPYCGTATPAPSGENYAPPNTGGGTGGKHHKKG